MGNSLTTKTLSFKDKFIKILENNLNQSELRDRFLDIQNLSPNEDSILSSITKEDFQSSIEKFPDNIITLIRFLIDSIFGLTELKRILVEEEVSILNFLLKMLARILPFLYDVIENTNFKIKLYLNRKNIMSFVLKLCGKIILIFLLMKLVDQERKNGLHLLKKREKKKRNLKWS